MPLDEATRRFAFLLQRDLRRISERREEHASRGEEMKFDSVSRVATVQTRRGDAVSKLYGEVLAVYAPEDRILRWSWAGRASSASPTHGDVVFREGQARGVPQLTMSVVGDLDEDDATTLVKLGALVARADGVHTRKIGADIEYIGVFERPRPADAIEPARENRFSVPPPPVAEKPTTGGGPAPRAYRSIPPIREIFEPRTSASRSSKPPSVEPTSESRSSDAPASLSSLPLPASAAQPASASQPPKKLREPSRALFLPVANAALAALARGSKGYLQGIFVVTLDADPYEPSTSGDRDRDRETPEKRRIVVQLVVVDAAGILRALDPSTEVIEAAATMVEADRREGNGQWRKLSARITPKADGGATLHVDVT